MSGPSSILFQAMLNLTLCRDIRIEVSILQTLAIPVFMSILTVQSAEHGGGPPSIPTALLTVMVSIR